jgi:hypothetical protein
MDRPPYPFGLSTLYQFPQADSPEEYRQMYGGKDPEPFDETRPVQGWEDALALNLGEEFITYPRVLACFPDGSPRSGDDGKPYMKTLIVPAARAAKANIPPAGNQNPGVGSRVTPVPLLPLVAGEYLDFGIGGVVVVKNKLYEQPEPVQFTEADRAAIQETLDKVRDLHAWGAVAVEAWKKEKGV